MKNAIIKFRDEIYLSIRKLRIHPLSSFILIGLTLRLFLAPLTSWTNDVYPWFAYANDMLAGLTIYETRIFSYPPLWAYTFGPIIKIAAIFFDPNQFGAYIDDLIPISSQTLIKPFVTSPIFNLLFKLPLILSDLMVGLFIYEVIKLIKNDQKSAQRGFCLWFFNPYVIWVNIIVGQIDVLPTFMTLLSFWFLYKRSYLMSGVSLSMGVLYKIYPLFLTPLYLCVIINDCKHLQDYKQVTAKRFLKFFGGALFPVLLFATPVYKDLFYMSSGAGFQTFFVGGLNAWFISYLPSFRWVESWASANSQMVFKVSTLLEIGAIAIFSLLSFISIWKNRLKTILLAHIQIFAVILATSPLTNPQFFMPLIAFVIIAKHIYDHYGIRAHLVWISPLIFLLGLAGPLAFFYPVAVYTSLVSVETINNGVQYFYSIPGLINQSLQRDVLLFSGALGFFTILSCLKPNLMIKFDEKDG